MSRTGIGIIVLLFLLGGVFYFYPYLKNGYLNLTGQLPSSVHFDDDNFSSWSEFTAQSGLFKVLLPHSPQYAKDLITAPNSEKKRRYDMYASEKIDGTLFLINVITYPEDSKISFNADTLKDAVNELAKSKPDNQIAKMNKSTFKDQPALDFKITSKEFDVEGITFIYDQAEYILTYVTRKNDFDPIEYNYFIDSFDLLEKDSLEKK